ncbi:MAG: helix-turn-helix domain-containing protein [Actinomycetota bacterium]|nr:helix-turn-helix domain-containing protein [Actinomycetota bacterium]
MKGASLIREARLRAGFTQKELAARLNTKQSVVSRWESGSVSPTIETLAEVAAACGLEVQVRLAERDTEDLHLALLDRSLTPEQRIDRMVEGMRFVDELRASINV